MERKRLIKPITVIKTVRFLQDVISHVQEEKELSLSQLCRKHSIGSNNSAAIQKLGFVVQSDVRGRFLFGDDADFIASEKYSKRLIEEVRTMKDKPKDNTYGFSLQTNVKSGDLSNDIHSLHENLSFKQNPVKWTNSKPNQSHDIFEEQRRKQDHLVQIASSIASGWYSEDEVINIEEANEFIVKAAKDLYKQLFDNN